MKKMSLKEALGVKDDDVYTDEYGEPGPFNDDDDDDDDGGDLDDRTPNPGYRLVMGFFDPAVYAARRGDVDALERAGDDLRELAHVSSGDADRLVGLMQAAVELWQEGGDDVSVKRVAPRGIAALNARAAAILARYEDDEELMKLADYRSDQAYHKEWGGLRPRNPFTGKIDGDE